MSNTRLKYLSSSVYDRLRAGVTRNLERYLAGDFLDLSETEGWAIPLSLGVDLTALSALRPENEPEAEIANSLLVWECLRSLTPSLASEGRLWARLTHVEGLSFSRARWVGNRVDVEAVDAVEVHFFGETRTRCRDDNAIGRLWWNAYVAHLAIPDDQQRALRAILKTADIRSNIIERPWISSRTQVVAGIVRTILRNPAATANERAFREFMKNLNKRGGGLLFEAMKDAEIDDLMDKCATFS